jgi:hypothetical protein
VTAGRTSWSWGDLAAAADALLGKPVPLEVQALGDKLAGDIAGAERQSGQQADMEAGE